MLIFHSGPPQAAMLPKIERRLGLEGPILGIFHGLPLVDRFLR
jgi:hypothetical protein